MDFKKSENPITSRKKYMGRPSFKELIKQIIASTCWKIFLWTIGMTAEEYWTEIYKRERDRRCIDTYPEREIESREY